jgi:hypothetical protein
LKNPAKRPVFEETASRFIVVRFVVQPADDANNLPCCFAHGIETVIDYIKPELIDRMAKNEIITSIQISEQPILREVID